MSVARRVVRVIVRRLRQARSWIVSGVFRAQRASHDRRGGVTRPALYLLVLSIDEATGVAKTMSNLANGLADRYDVDVISLFRFADLPTYAVDPRVRLTYLEDVRRGGPAAGAKLRALRARDNPRRTEEDRELDRQPSVLVAYKAPTSALTDRALERYLSALRPGILISNRPFLHQAAARWVPAHTKVLATEHSTFEQRNEQIRALFQENAARFDAVVTVSEEDRSSYEDLLGGQTRVVAIPNAVPNPGKQVSPLDGTVVIAAGALVPRKGFDRLIEAFAPLVPSHPDWRLHIYGKGGERAKLERQIEEAGLGRHVILKGFDSGYQDRLRGASAFALTSHFESFGMVIIEAMGAGVPVVAFDCPSGPRQLIRDGYDGVLVPNDDIPAFTEGLRRLMDDVEFRKRAGAAAVVSAAAYSLEAVVDRWLHLFAELDMPAAGSGDP